MAQENDILDVEERFKRELEDLEYSNVFETRN